MLNKEESIEMIWKRRISRIVIVLCVVSFFYYLEGLYMWDGEFHIVTFFKKLYSSPLKPPLWYLYIYIAFLICLPFTRAVVKITNESMYKYMFFIAIFFQGVIPTVDCFCFHNEISLFGVSPWMLSNIFLYPCMGYYFIKIIDVKKIKINTLVILWILTLVEITLTCFISDRRFRIRGEYADETLFQMYVLILCATVILTIRYFFEGQTTGAFVTRIIGILGQCTFGVYLFHYLMWDWNWMQRQIHKVVGFGMNQMAVIFGTSIFIMVICYVFTYILRMIPFLRKYI